MAKAETYKKKIRAIVKADNGGTVPERLSLTIDSYANALELRDYYTEKMMASQWGPIIYEQGSMGNQVTKQHPLCNLIYQQESICQTYAKMLGLTAAKAAVKPDDPSDRKVNNSLKDFIDGING